MSYLEDFQEQLDKGDFHKFLQLWEEYCTAEEVDPPEFIAVLKAVKASESAEIFGRYAETALPLWQTVQDERASYDILRLIIDLQTTNTPLLAETAYNALEKHYGDRSNFSRSMRLIGLRQPKGLGKANNFQGTISHYELLIHLEEGNFVYHTAGWGTGEIIDVSMVREEVVCEFENVLGRKSLSFKNAFKTLIPLKKDHFSVRRFAFPDELEEEARKKPVEVVKLLLGDLGPKTAAEIKDELCELVIPEDDWTKWWQSARAKLKKDTMVETPSSLRKPFRLRSAALSHEELFHKEISAKNDVGEILQTTYNFVRDLPDMLKKDEVKQSLRDKLFGLLQEPTISPAQALQVHIFLQHYFGEKVNGKTVADVLQEMPEIEKIINEMEIVAFKKRALTSIRSKRSDWVQLFLSFLFSLQQNQLRDYVLKELNQEESQAKLEEAIHNLLSHPVAHPEVFIWYFQKVVGKDQVPFSHKQGQCEFLETFLILYSVLESKPEYRELMKKMYQLLSGKRYLIVRNIIEGTTLEFIREFLLLVSKCRTLSDHDKKIMKSLAEVVHPSLATKKSRSEREQPLWTTEDGLRRTQQRVEHIGTVEIVENAKEIEEARALGDLRENSEYKFALERRSRLQSEMKMLSDQINRARIITPDDVVDGQVSVGTKVNLTNGEGSTVTYTILGPWEADSERNILSFQSKLAESMIGKEAGDTVDFKEEVFTITQVQSVFA